MSQAHPTKREMLSATAKFYDHLGYISPVILPLKCMFQEICQLKMNWDTPLPVKLHKKWVEITNDMATVQAIEIPRCVLQDLQSEDINSLQLQGFIRCKQGYVWGECAPSSENFQWLLDTFNCIKDE